MEKIISMVGIITIVFSFVYLILKKRFFFKISLTISKKSIVQIFIFLLFILFVIFFMDKRTAYLISNRYPNGIISHYPILSTYLNSFFKFITHLGETDFIGFEVLPFLLYGIYIKNNRIKDLSFGVIVSIIFAGILVSILKVIFARSRPYQDWNNLGFYFVEDFVEKEIPYKGSYLSFPSGHTLTACAAYLFLYLESKNILTSSLLAYPIAKNVQVNLDRYNK